MHLLGRSLKEPTAAGGKKCIPAEKIVAKEISEVAGRMTRNEENLAPQFTDLNLVSVVNAVRETGDSS